MPPARNETSVDGMENEDELAACYEDKTMETEAKKQACPALSVTTLT